MGNPSLKTLSKCLTKFPPEINEILKFVDGTVLQRHDDSNHKISPRSPSSTASPQHDGDYDDGDKENGVRRHRIRRKDDEVPESYSAGEEVDVRHGGGKKLYPARIGGVNGDGTYDIAYDDGDKEKYVKADHIKPNEQSKKTDRN